MGINEIKSGATRTEHDLLGYREVPSDVLYGIQTLRALENFNITGVADYTIGGQSGYTIMASSGLPIIHNQPTTLIQQPLKLQPYAATKNW